MVRGAARILRTGLTKRGEGFLIWARIGPAPSQLDRGCILSALGEVAESAEGSRLLSGYRVKSSVPGSNPGLSAKFPRRPKQHERRISSAPVSLSPARAGRYFFWSVIPAAFAASSYLASDSACLPAACSELACAASEQALAAPGSKRFPIALSICAWSSGHWLAAAGAAAETTRTRAVTKVFISLLLGVGTGRTGSIAGDDRGDRARCQDAMQPGARGSRPCASAQPQRPARARRRRRGRGRPGLRVEGDVRDQRLAAEK